VVYHFVNFEKKATPKFFVGTCLFYFRGFIPLKTAKFSDKGSPTIRKPLANVLTVLVEKCTTLF